MNIVKISSKDGNEFVIELDDESFNNACRHMGEFIEGFGDKYGVIDTVHFIERKKKKGKQ